MECVVEVRDERIKVIKVFRVYRNISYFIGFKIYLGEIGGC